MTHSVSRAIVLTAGLLLTATCLAQSPQVGAWRKVSDSQLDKQYHFSMLPSAAPVASKWAAFDAKAGKVVCCLVVQGEAVTEAELEGTYDIPGPWITDLTNGWNLDAAPYRPRVQRLRAEGRWTHTNSRTAWMRWEACWCRPMPARRRGVRWRSAASATPYRARMRRWPTMTAAWPPTRCVRPRAARR